ncbi:MULTISPECIES: ATP-binding protein [unclassified Streptomyces]|uniref:ATP-binding protein n=1 Tax=unclassified Streptomyces TaxID=2593676 RepID=UPI002DD82445|nr:MULTISPECIES: ATP-binding protein [unclassified Streptomyces]WSA93224.1 ATP-binding protein [Streptomyces sp. NBC_01795]WSB77595.1 ATP-binding protein [Streptomyces sp. NBC_01775]WSS14138.1 ATP-binding protein [Streptomyces sp. NBC_01186]WSS42960.1 ATP-binding protein [Streptomyces sp. NBC_01187]
MGTDGSTVLEPLWQGLVTRDATSVSGSASCTLPPHYESVKSARDFTRRTLQNWGLTEEFDDVALVVSELVTNAMRHGLAPGADHGAASGDEGDPPVRLHLMRWSARLVCAVRDPSDEPPDTSGLSPAGPAALGGHREGTIEHGGNGGHGERGANGGYGGHGGTAEALVRGNTGDPADGAEALTFAAESGRGLCLVDSFSDNWGWHPLSGPLAGKIVWALFRLGPA